MSLSFNLPASGVSKALDNLNNLSWLLASLYPTYKDTVNANSVAASPLHRVRYGNLICSSTNDGQGLLCVLNGVTVTHDHTYGFVSVNPKNMGSSFANVAARVLDDAGFKNHVGENKKFIIPKVMKLTLGLDVVHDHPLGWDFYTGQFRGGRTAKSYPYDFGLMRDPGDSPSVGVSVMTNASAGAAGSPTAPSTQEGNAAAACTTDDATSGAVTTNCD